MEGGKRLILLYYIQFALICGKLLAFNFLYRYYSTFNSRYLPYAFEVIEIIPLFS